MKEAAVFGLGRFGRLMCSLLKTHFDLCAYDPAPVEGAARELGIPLVNLAEAARKPLLLLSAPISSMEPLLHAIAVHVRPGTLVCDTCSVKVRPVALMEELLPDHVEILGTHPCFGPDSVQVGLRGNNIVLCPVRVKAFDRIETFLREMGLTVIVSTPDEHDRIMARTLAISQFLGRGVLRMGLRQEKMSTTGFSRLLEILEYVRHDSEELFRDLQTMNPYAGEMRRELIRVLAEVDEELRGVSWSES